MSWAAESSRRVAPGLARMALARTALALAALGLAGCAARAPVATGGLSASLAAVDHPGARARLAAAADDDDPVVRARAAAARVALGEGPDGVGLDDDSAWVRRTVAEALSDRLPDRAVRDALLQAVADETLDPVSRCAVLAPVVAAEPGLAAMVRPWTDGPRPPQACLVVAATAGADGASAALLASLRAGSLKLDLASVGLLADSTVPDLAQALADGLPRVEPLALASAAAVLLAHDHPEGRRLMRAVLAGESEPGDEGEEAAMEGIDWLIARPVPGGVELLSGARGSARPRVVAYAAVATLAYGVVDGPALRAVAHAPDTETARLALAAARVGVVRFPDEAAVQRAARKLARALLPAEDPRTRAAVAELVLVLDDASLRREIEPWLSDDDARVAVATAAALALHPAP